jgi:hypothetical protein
VAEAGPYDLRRSGEPLMRYAIVLVLLAGCVQNVDTVGDLQPLVAVGGAYGVVQVKNAPKPAPAPVWPVVPSKCSNCGGTGYIGDGRVKMPCPVCSPAPKKGQATAQNCPGGQCRPTTVR